MPKQGSPDWPVLPGDVPVGTLTPAHSPTVAPASAVPGS